MLTFWKIWGNLIKLTPKSLIMKKLLFIAALLLFAGIASGQILKKGCVVAVSSYEVTLQPDVTMNQWLEFNRTKWVPAAEKVFPGIKIFIVMGDRGESANMYGEIWVFDSKETRDKYWPTEEGDTAWPEGAQEILTSISNETSNYVISATRTFTDWIVQ